MSEEDLFICAPTCAPHLLSTGLSNHQTESQSTCVTRPGFMIKMHLYVRNLHFVAATLERLHYNRQTKHVQVHLCKNLSAFPLLYFGTSF